MKIQPTLASPRCRTLRISAIVFSHPKHSSIRFRFFWLIAYPACRVVRSSMALPPGRLVLRHVRRHVHDAGIRHEFLRIISFVGSHRDPLAPGNLLQHHQRRIALGCTVGLNVPASTISPLRFSISRLPL